MPVQAVAYNELAILVRRVKVPGAKCGSTAQATKRHHRGFFCARQHVTCLNEFMQFSPQKL